MSPNLSPGARLDHYEIKSQLGAGGMGEVYLAQDTKLDRKVARKILPALDPLSPIIGTNLGDALVFARRYDEAIAQYKHTLVSNPEFGYAHQALGWAARSGKREEALQLLSELKQEPARSYVQPYTFALIYIGLGDKTEALNWLEKQMIGHSETASQYAVEPELDGLRSEPRFKEMLKQMNLPE